MISLIKTTTLPLLMLALIATTTYAEQHTYTFNINTGNDTSDKINIIESVKTDNNFKKRKKERKRLIAKIKKQKILTKVQKYNLNNNVNKYNSLNSAIENLAQRLLDSSRVEHRYLEEIAVTTFVDLHKFSKTSHFGRSISESFFDELFTRGFNVTDFRGQDTLTINKYGEYFLTRDKKLLNKEVKNKHILVGTYSKFEDSILISARIINNTSGKIIASARTYYNTTDCKLLENCPKPRRIKIVSHDNYLAREDIKAPLSHSTEVNIKATAICKTSKPKKLKYSSKRNSIISLIN